MRKREIWILLAGLVLGVLFMRTDHQEQVTLIRPDYGEDDAQQSVYYERESGESGEFTVCVPAKTYTQEELSGLATETFSQLEKIIPGQNSDMHAICQDLKLPDQVQAMPFAIDWWSDTPELISDQGEVHNETLTEQTDCVLHTQIRYADYMQTRQYILTVLPKEYSEKEQFIQQLQDALQAYLQETTSDEDAVTLPEKVLDAKIYSGQPDNHTWMFFPLAAICAVIYLRVHVRQTEKDALQAEQQALLEAYPAFVNQLTLYMASGMTIRTAMEQIMKMYRQKTGKEAVLGRRLEHMLLRIQNGVSECRAYQEFGKSCEHQQYQKLMSVLIQTVQMGGKGVINRLTELEEDAFVLRKEQARTKGEAASTKLLFPMVLLLAVVMVLLMVPGFYGIGDVM